MGDQIPEVMLLAQRVEAMHEDFNEMQLVLRELTAAITKLALVEERQSQQSAALDRAFKVLERLEARTALLELAAPDHKRAAAWMDRGAFAALGVLGMYVAKKLGLI